MLPVLIFSKDRACQLHLLLESLDRKAKDIFDITVVYKASNAEYKEAYDLLKNRFSFLGISDINFKEETILYEDITNWFFNTTRYYEKVLFMVDDQICYNEITSRDLEIIDRELEQPTALSFSLRLDPYKWENDYGLKRHADFIRNLFKYKSDCVYWNISDFNYYFPGCNYAYPMSLDAHIYTKDFLQQFFSALLFSSVKMKPEIDISTPNDFETKLNNMFYRHKVNEETVYSFSNAKLVNSPCNRVQNSHQNGFGEIYNYTQESLNCRYLNNCIIDYDVIDFSEAAYAPHTELEFHFKEYK